MKQRSIIFVENEKDPAFVAQVRRRAKLAKNPQNHIPLDEAFRQIQSRRRVKVAPINQRQRHAAV